MKTGDFEVPTLSSEPTKTENATKPPPRCSSPDSAIKISERKKAMAREFMGRESLILKPTKELLGIEEGTVRIAGRSHVRIGVAPHLETIIRCERVSFVVDGRKIEIRGAVIRIEGESP